MGERGELLVIFPRGFWWVAGWEGGPGDENQSALENPYALGFYAGPVFWWFFDSRDYRN